MEHTVSGQQFKWCSKFGTAAATALGIPHGVSPEAINVRSHRTGRVVRFVRATAATSVPYTHVYHSVGEESMVSLVVFPT